VAVLGSVTSSTNGVVAAPVGVAAAAAVATVPRPAADVRLLTARVISRQGLSISIVPLDEEVGVEMTYEVRGGSALIVPSLCLNSPDGSLVFWAVPAENDPANLTAGPGRHRATAWLPAHFLNTGAYSVGISLVGPEESPMRRYVQVGEALSFVAVEAQHGGARGILPREFPGAIRPRLDWETRPV
jgi:lipopolysaccharide transport system ATP-binding protein